MRTWRKFACLLAVLYLGACSSIDRNPAGSIVLIDLHEAGAPDKRGVVAFAAGSLNYADVVRLKDTIRGELFVGKPPKTIDACFYLSPDAFGLVRLRSKTTKSFVLDVEKFPDAGSYFQIEMHSDETVSGFRIFWSSGSPKVESKILGRHSRVQDISACTERFPT